jgi:integrase
LKWTSLLEFGTSPNDQLSQRSYSVIFSARSQFFLTNTTPSEDFTSREDDPLQVWLQEYDRETTRVVYKYRIKKILEPMKVTAKEFLETARGDPVNSWVQLKAKTVKFPPMIRYNGFSALRSFLAANGVYVPQTRERRPFSNRTSNGISWEEAHAVIAAAPMPWSAIFKLMLYCAWGAREFLEFNTVEHWNEIKTKAAENPEGEYYKCNFPWRKSNGQPYFSLIPSCVIKQIIQANIPLPLTTKKGSKLDSTNYWNARLYLTNQFTKALKKSGIQRSWHGKVSMHDLRDTFRTRATIRQVVWEAKEFAMGHTVDKAGYDKSYYDEPWLWGELSKIYNE